MARKISHAPAGGSELEQIQLLVVRASGQAIERQMGTRQD
jgi:hypothetical protein